jgi:hypothetical protein
MRPRVDRPRQSGSPWRRSSSQPRRQHLRPPIAAPIAPDRRPTALLSVARMPRCADIDELEVIASRRGRTIAARPLGKRLRVRALRLAVDVTAAMRVTRSGLRGSNPCPRLGKPLYYHCTKPALDAGLGPSCDDGILLYLYDRISATTSSRFFSISSGVIASRFSRSSGSVLDGRTLKCQSAYSTDNPSSLYWWPSPYFAAI